MAEIQWYYARGGEQMGPVSPAGLKQIAQAGEISAGDLVWREGMAEWAPAGTVKGLFPDGVAEVAARAAPAVTATPSQTPTAAAATAELQSPSSAPTTTPAQSAAPMIRSESNAHRFATAGGGTSRVVQLVLWILCGVIVIIAACQFTVAALRAESPSDRAVAAAVFSAYFVGAYVVARAGERLCMLIENWNKR